MLSDEAITKGSEDLDDWFERLRNEFLAASPARFGIGDRQTVDDEAVAGLWRDFTRMLWPATEGNELEMVTDHLGFVGDYYDDDQGQNRAFNEGYIHGRLGERYDRDGEYVQYVLLANLNDDEEVWARLHDARYDQMIDTDISFAVDDRCPTLQEFQQADPTIKTPSAGHGLSL